MKIKFEHFGIIKDKEYLQLSKYEKYEKLSELNLTDTKFPYETVYKKTTYIRDEFITNLIGKYKANTSIKVLNKAILQEIRGFLETTYSSNFDLSLLKFLHIYNEEIYALNNKEKRKKSSKYYKKFTKKINILLKSNNTVFPNNTSYLNKIAILRDSDTSFIQSSQEIIDNYLTGNKSYFSKLLINHTVFDNFFTIETTFRKLLELNKLYNFDPFCYTTHQYLLFLYKRKKYRDLFKGLDPFLFLNQIIINNNLKTSEIISLVIFLNEEKLIKKKYVLMTNFLFDYYDIKISKIKVVETNLEHVARLKLYKESYEKFNNISD